jgi:hypothetical protein
MTPRHRRASTRISVSRRDELAALLALPPL